MNKYCECKYHKCENPMHKEDIILEPFQKCKICGSEAFHLVIRIKDNSKGTGGKDE